jgi:hypothetical protein
MVTSNIQYSTTRGVQCVGHNSTCTTVQNPVRQNVSPNYDCQDDNGTHAVLHEHADQTQPAMQSAYLTQATCSGPKHSNVPLDTRAPWAQGKLTTQKLEAFATAKLPTSVQIQLSQTFGKDSVSQSFYSQKCFRHVLLPVLKSGYLSCKATKQLK